FHDCDEGGKNCLTREDLKVAIVSLFGYKPSKMKKVKEFLAEFSLAIYRNIKSIKCIEFWDIYYQILIFAMNKNKFVEAMTSYIIKHDEDEDIRHTFLAFDTQCKGFLTFEDLHKVVKQVAPHLKPNVVETAFRELDRDGDKRISYKDFDFMMKYGTDI
ncbi:hypothetical protein LOTGIDRAFT_118510, partial [Lottia gigantea]